MYANLDYIPRLINHIIQSLVYVFNITVGYFLMNIVMCYYAGHFLAIIFGCTFGYYFLHVASPDFEGSISNESINLNINHDCNGCDNPTTSARANSNAESNYQEL
jgi:hypothetical protein